MFEIRLVARNGEAVDPSRLLEVVRSLEHARDLPADPHRLLYRNEDTGVSLNIILGPEVVQAREEGVAAEVGVEETGEGEPEGSVEDDAGDPASGDEDGEAEEEPEDEEAEESLDVVLPPAMLVVPVLCPAFFALEAFAVAERLAAASGLALAPLPEESEAPAQPAAAAAQPPTADQVLAAWRRTSRAALLELPEGSEVAVWPAAKTEAWWRYGTCRRALAAELEPQGIHVPPVFAARHAGQVKTLCIWEEGTPAAFPRTDLVLVRRKRRRQGLLWARRVAEEGLVEGPRFWDLLRPGSELRDQGVEVLVFRSAAAPPGGVAADLEVLRLEPAAGARRTELLGVLDADVARSVSEEDPAWKGAS